MKTKGTFLSLLLLVIACASSKSKNGPDADRAITSDLEASEEKSPVEFATELQGLDAVPIADQQESEKSNDGEPNGEESEQKGTTTGVAGAATAAATTVAAAKSGADGKSTAVKNGNSKSQDGKFTIRDGVNAQNRIKGASSAVGNNGGIGINAMMGGNGFNGGNSMNGSNGIIAANGIIANNENSTDNDSSSSEKTKAKTEEANAAKENIESKNKKANRSLASKSVDQMIEYRVKSGDTFMKISFQFLGDLTRWREIYEDNKKIVANPNLLSKGTLLKVHVFNVVSVQKNGEPYFIKRGDTLAKISKWVYGTFGKWKMLWDNNKQLIHHPDKIFAGFTLYYKEEKQPNNRTIATEKNNHGAAKQ